MGSRDLLEAVIEEADHGLLVLTLVGEIDLESAPLLSERFRALVDRNPTKVIIDASGVTFMDSTGIHTLVEGKRSLHEIEASIALVSSRIVRRVLDLVFPAPLFAERVNSIDEAWKYLGEQPPEN